MIQRRSYLVHTVTFRLTADSPQCVFLFMTSALSKRLLAAFAATAVGVTMTACGGSGGGGGGDTASDGDGGGAATEFDGEIKVGILHSLSGTMAISETTLKEVEELA